MIPLDIRDIARLTLKKILSQRFIQFLDQQILNETTNLSIF